MSAVPHNNTYRLKPAVLEVFIFISSNQGKKRYFDDLIKGRSAATAELTNPKGHLFAN
jgi:hypothetical protein